MILGGITNSLTAVFKRIKELKEINDCCLFWELVFNL